MQTARPQLSLYTLALISSKLQDVFQPPRCSKSLRLLQVLDLVFLILVSIRRNNIAITAMQIV